MRQQPTQMAALSHFDQLHARAGVLAQYLLNGSGARDMGDQTATILHLLLSDEVSAVGQWHPYGFFVTKIALLENLGALRLHVWPDEPRIAQDPHWPVHCHRWTLRSSVLSGSIENVWYEAQPGLSSRLYGVTYTGNASVLTRTDACATCVETSRRMIRAGESYSVRCGDYHATSIAPDSFAATLVLTTVERDDVESHIAGALDGATSYRFERAVCCGDLYRRSLRRLLDQIVPNARA